MTAEQRHQSRRIVALAILATVALLLLAVVALGPRLLDDVSARYSQPSYSPERAELCPGAVLRSQYQVQPRTPGPVEIMSAWCNADRGTCLLPETTVAYAIVVSSRDAISATLAVTIPVSSQMTPGSRWQYVRSVRKLGQSKFDMFTVPFIISPSCD